MFTRKLLLAAPLLFLASLASAFAEWETDYDKALQKAKAENKQVLLDFTGSDWCGPCIQLNKSVFATKEFRAYAEKNLVFVEVDYPRAKKLTAELVKQNEKLGKEYGIEEKGFPTLVLLDSSGKVVRELTGYDGEVTSDVVAWIEGKGNR